MLVDFHGLFGRHSQDVYRFALYLSGNPSLAGEITQETFVRAWVMPGEVRGGSVHVALDGTLPDPRPNAEAVAWGRLELEAAFEALQTLPETDRAALLMHAQDGLPYAAIASVLGLSTTAVKVRAHRARIKLRRPCEPKGG